MKSLGLTLKSWTPGSSPGFFVFNNEDCEVPPYCHVRLDQKMG